MNKVVLITGGSQGLGREIAEQLSSDYTVVILTNDQPSLESAKNDLKVDSYFCDVTDPVQIEKTVGEILSKFGRIDVLVNNAGVWAGGELDNNSYSDIARVLMVNTAGTMYMTKAVIPVMKKQGSGRIVNIGSTNGIETKSDRSIYIASKWAVNGFSGALRKELEKYKIGVSCVNPGLVETNLHKNGGSTRDYSCAMKAGEAAKVVAMAVRSEPLIENMVFRNLNCESY
jgi:short-subunit dehydrogenase